MALTAGVCIPAPKDRMTDITSKPPSKAGSDEICGIANTITKVTNAISTLRMTLMIDIVTAILGTGLLSCLALPKQNTSIEKASVFSDMKIGVKYAFADKLIGKLLIIYLNFD